MRVHHIYQSFQQYNLCMSQQCIMGQGKLVMVLVQLTFMKQLYNSDYIMQKITIHDFEIYLRQSA